LANLPQSFAQGAEGRLRVYPVQGSISFYTKLGFALAEQNYYVLNAASAAALLATVTLSAE